MDLKNKAKTLLRMCGHAFGSTIHDRLDGVEYSLQQILEQNTHIAGTQTALLQAGVHIVESGHRVEAGVSEGEGRLIAGTRAALLQAEVRIAEGVQRVEASVSEGEGRLIAGTRAALLQAEMRIVEGVQRVEASISEAEGRLGMLLRDFVPGGQKTQALKTEIDPLREYDTRSALNSSIEALQAVWSPIEHRQEAAASAIRSGVETMVSLADSMRNATAASLAVIEPAARATNEFLANQSVRQVCVETSDYFFTNPELGLLEFLYSYLPSRIVLDVGANAGDVSEHLLNAGYEVYAFEPYPHSYRRLTERLGARRNFHSFNLALGSVSGELPMHTVLDQSPERIYEDTSVYHTLAPHSMPDGLSFQSTVQVGIRTLVELHREGRVPENASVVKIDTEGYDLEVIRGMEDQRYPVVMVEFWDARIPFAKEGLLYTMESMVHEMRQRGYAWSIVIYRIWGHNETAFFCNHDRPVPNSWGNIIFFQDRQVFAQAQQWCSAVLPRTYFKHVPAAAGESFRYQNGQRS